MLPGLQIVKDPLIAKAGLQNRIHLPIVYLSIGRFNIITYQYRVKYTFTEDTGDFIIKQDKLTKSNRAKKVTNFIASLTGQEIYHL